MGCVRFDDGRAAIHVRGARIRYGLCGSGIQYAVRGAADWWSTVCGAGRHAAGIAADVARSAAQGICGVLYVKMMPVRPVDLIVHAS